MPSSGTRCWRDLDIAPMRNLQQAVQDLYILASPQSPMRDLLAGITRQLTLTQPPPPPPGVAGAVQGAAQAAGAAAAQAATGAAGAAAGSARRRPAGRRRIRRARRSRTATPR